MSTPPVAPPADGKAVRSDLRNLEKVRGIFASLAKFVNAQAIYQTNNPHFIKTAQAFDQSFRSYFETEAELVLTVSQYQLLWREQIVYDIGCNTESIAFLLYKDGIGEISIQAAVGRSELEQFTGILKGALYNPSAQFDTASALWQAEFPNIFYRVLDEQTDGAGGDGDGSGNMNREQPLRANDHQDLALVEDNVRHRSDAALVTLGAYFDALVEDEYPSVDTPTREAQLQRAIAAHVEHHAQELERWNAAPRSGHEGDELIAFLRVMLDFTQTRITRAVTRDVQDTIERLTHYIRDEGNIATLTATLELMGEADVASLDPGFATLLDRVEHDFTEPDYLTALARGLRSGNTPEELLRYLSLAGENAITGLCELLARTSDEAIHEKCCDVLYNVAGNDLLGIIDRLDVSNPLIAGDVVRLLGRSPSGAIPAVVQRILSSQDSAIRRCAIDYLVQNGSDEAARLVVGLFKDANQGVRVRTFAALERLRHPLVVNELTSLCFAEQSVLKNPEELEFMFRALGKVAGVTVLPRLRQTVEKKHLLPSAKARSKRDKILALTALRYIPGEEARNLIEKLSQDSDQLVKTKAQHVLKSLKQGLGSDLYDRLDSPSPSPETSPGKLPGTSKETS